MYFYCDECTKPTPGNDKTFTEGGGVLCEACRAKKEKPAEPIKCRGRNGYFKFDSYHVFGSKEVVFVDIESSKPGKAAPISFSGNRKGMIALFTGILTTLKDD